MSNISGFWAFIFGVVALWGQQSDAIDFTIHIDDIPRLIFNPGDLHHDTTFTLGPKEYHAFYDHLEQRASDSWLKNKSSLYRPFIIGPTPPGKYDKSFRVVAPDSSALISVVHKFLVSENIENLFMIWKIQGDSLVLKCIPDTCVSTSFGYMHFEEIHQLPGHGFLLIGTSNGGDDGDGWKSVWFAEWDGGCHLDGVYEHRSSTKRCSHRENLEYVFDPHTFVATLTKRHDKVIDCKDDNQPIYTDSVIVTTERVDILKLLR